MVITHYAHTTREEMEMMLSRPLVVFIRNQLGEISVTRKKIYMDTFSFIKIVEVIMDISLNLCLCHIPGCKYVIA